MASVSCTTRLAELGASKKSQCAQAHTKKRLENVMVKTTPKILNKLAIALAIAATSTLAAGCFGGSFAFAVMPAEGHASAAPRTGTRQGLLRVPRRRVRMGDGQVCSAEERCKWVAGRYKVKRRGNVKIKT